MAQSNAERQKGTRARRNNKYKAMESVIIEANNSLFGSQGFFLSLDGGEANKYHLSRAIEELKARQNRFWRALNEIAKYGDPDAKIARAALNTNTGNKP